ncbi:rCG65845 [Rattus norvegicus]|nr:rCG65845 [Rattus norvegicus]
MQSAVILQGQRRTETATGEERRSSQRFRASLVLDLQAPAWSASSFLAGLVCLQFVDVLHENPLALEYIPFDLQIQGVIYMAVNLLRFQLSLRSRHRILILLIQVTFSGIQALAVPFLFPMLICLPFRRSKVFFRHRAREWTDSHRLPDDQAIFDQLPDLLTGVGIGNFFGLIELKSEWIKDLHIKPDTLKLIEEKLGQHLEHMGTGKNFLNKTPMAYALRSRIDKWDLIKLQTSVRQRTLWLGQKRQPTDWKKIFTNPTTDRGLISKIYKELKKLDCRETNNPVKKWGSELNKEFTAEECRMAEKHLKKCSTTLVIKEMQIKTTLRFHLTPVRMAKIKNSGDNKCWRGCGERGTLFHCWWDCRLVKPFWKSVWRFLRKLDIELPEDPAIPLLGIYPQDAPTYKKRHVLHYVHSSLVYNSQKLERTQMPFNRGMDTENVVHLHSGILLSYQKQCLYEIHRQMVGTGKYHPE